MTPSTRSTRLMALILKETRQLWRDKSNLAVGLLLPIVLILLFGYGLSFDLTHTPLAIVLADTTPQARDLASQFRGNPYIYPILSPSMADAEKTMGRTSPTATLGIPPDFSNRLGRGHAEVQLIVNGTATTTANTVEGYVNGVLGVQRAKAFDRAGSKAPPSSGGVAVVQRLWFNEASDSTWYLVPGLVVLVLTLIGAFLTSLLIVRERERGTLEALYVTPVRPTELLAAKLLPYLVLGIVDLGLCLLASRFVFNVPVRGSVTIIILSSVLYLTVSLAMGLLISGKAASQFQASQIALLMSFMPAMMLSGFVFDLDNMPAVVRTISKLLPATHFMPMIKTLFLAGNDWHMMATECGILVVYALLFLGACRTTLRKKLG